MRTRRGADANPGSIVGGITESKNSKKNRGEKEGIFQKVSIVQKFSARGSEKGGKKRGKRGEKVFRHQKGVHEDTRHVSENYVREKRQMLIAPFKEGPARRTRRRGRN